MMPLFALIAVVLLGLALSRTDAAGARPSGRRTVDCSKVEGVAEPLGCSHATAQATVAVMTDACVECGSTLLRPEGRAPVAPTAPGEYVVLLHGHGRTGLSMKPVEWALTRRGYRVVNVTYPSCRVPVERLADEHLHRALTERVPADATRVHFVTHSMGGILVRQYLATHDFEKLGRVVMLGPPNQGSELADQFKWCAFTRWLGGRNLPRLGTGADDLPQQLGPVDFECGIIAGDRPAFGWPRLTAGPSDGKVTVASTQVVGMRGFATVHASHTFMMWRRETLELIVGFLAHGYFPATR